MVPASARRVRDVGASGHRLAVAGTRATWLAPTQEYPRGCCAWRSSVVTDRVGLRALLRRRRDDAPLDQPRTLGPRPGRAIGPDLARVARPAQPIDPSRASGNLGDNRPRVCQSVEGDAAPRATQRSI